MTSYINFISLAFKVHSPQVYCSLIQSQSNLLQLFFFFFHLGVVIQEKIYIKKTTLSFPKLNLRLKMLLVTILQYLVSKQVIHLHVERKFYYTPKQSFKW